MRAGLKRHREAIRAERAFSEKFENKLREFGAKLLPVCSRQPEENGGRIWAVDCIFGSQGRVVRKNGARFWAAPSLRIGNQEQAAGERPAAVKGLWWRAGKDTGVGFWSPTTITVRRLRHSENGAHRVT